jgi:hypothetical protein
MILDGILEAVLKVLAVAGACWIAIGIVRLFGTMSDYLDAATANMRASKRAHMASIASQEALAEAIKSHGIGVGIVGGSKGPGEIPFQ